MVKSVAFVIFCRYFLGQEIAARYEFVLETVGTDGDHIHLLVGASPRYAPSRLCQIFKSISAKEMFKTFPELRKQLWGGEFWSDGGYVGTVGEGVNIDIIRAYIIKQGTKEDLAQLKLLLF